MPPCVGKTTAGDVSWPIGAEVDTALVVEMAASPTEMLSTACRFRMGRVGRPEPTPRRSCAGSILRASCSIATAPERVSTAWRVCATVYAPFRAANDTRANQIAKRRLFVTVAIATRLLSLRVEG